MVARGLLANPAMFAGYEETPLKCIWDWVDIALELGTPFMCFHQHLIYMMEKITSRQEKRVFNALSSTSAVLDYLTDNYGIWLDCLSHCPIYFIPRGAIWGHIKSVAFNFNTTAVIGARHGGTCLKPSAQKAEGRRLQVLDQQNSVSKNEWKKNSPEFSKPGAGEIAHS